MTKNNQYFYTFSNDKMCKKEKTKETEINNKQKNKIE
jgi:hypothetical protein